MLVRSEVQSSTTFRFVAVCLFAAFVFPASPAQAGGIQLWEIGTPDVGLAAAGWAARAQDASTVFKNPAGMNHLDVPQLQIGAQFAYGQFGFTPESGTTVPGNGGGNPAGFIPGGSLFWAQRVSDVVAVGMGAFSYFGSSLEFDQDFVGRYDVEKSLILGFSLMPAVSFQITDWFAWVRASTSCSGSSTTRSPSTIRVRRSLMVNCPSTTATWASVQTSGPCSRFETERASALATCPPSSSSSICLRTFRGSVRC